MSTTKSDKNFHASPAEPKNMGEHAQNIEILQGKVAELQETRQNLHLLQWAKK